MNNMLLVLKKSHNKINDYLLLVIASICVLCQFVLTFPFLKKPVLQKNRERGIVTVICIWQIWVKTLLAVTEAKFPSLGEGYYLE